MIDTLQEFVNEYHVLRNGLIALGVIFAVTVCFRTLWGTWKHKDKCEIIKGRSHRTAFRDVGNREIIEDHPSRPDWRKSDERETIKK